MTYSCNGKTYHLDLDNDSTVPGINYPSIPFALLPIIIFLLILNQKPEFLFFTTFFISLGFFLYLKLVPTNNRSLLPVKWLTFMYGFIFPLFLYEIGPKSRLPKELLEFVFWLILATIILLLMIIILKKILSKEKKARVHYLYDPINSLTSTLMWFAISGTLLYLILLEDFWANIPLYLLIFVIYFAFIYSIFSSYNRDTDIFLFRNFRNEKKPMTTDLQKFCKKNGLKLSGIRNPQKRIYLFVRAMCSTTMISGVWFVWRYYYSGYLNLETNLNWRKELCLTLAKAKGVVIYVEEITPSLEFELLLAYLLIGLDRICLIFEESSYDRVIEQVNHLLQLEGVGMGNATIIVINDFRSATVDTSNRELLREFVKRTRLNKMLPINNELTRSIAYYDNETIRKNTLFVKFYNFLSILSGLIIGFYLQLVFMILIIAAILSALSRIFP